MSELCRCGHPKHHHNGGCGTVTVSGFATEDHFARGQDRCPCAGFEQ